MHALVIFLSIYQSQSKHSRLVLQKKLLLQKLYGHFLWMGFKATEPLQGDSLLFITKYPGVPGTYFIHLKRLKG